MFQTAFIRNVLFRSRLRNYVQPLARQGTHAASCRKGTAKTLAVTGRPVPDSVRHSVAALNIMRY